ncbi:RHS repeat-associated core domain-containing protein [Ekhidna sp. To15]|uniref:RHS repeat-associated core domain-containing protein n=1 Tax=Ekhidna sp. To15 TaxID=3395267 RepID=UPI003F52819F
MYQSGYASYDSLTGYYDFLFRSYDPALGRFFAFDPMASSTPSYSPYHANFNNPISFVDPLGLSPSDYRLKDFGGNENANDGMYTGDFGPGMLGSGGLGNINALAGPDAVYGQANWAIQNGFWDAIPDGYYVNDGGGNFERVSNKRRVKIYVVETGSGVYWTPFRENFEGIDGILRVDQDWITGKQAEELLQQSGGNTTVYVEEDGVGHVYVDVDGTVYSYGRYLGSDSPMLGEFGPVGPGVLIKLKGSAAKNFIKTRTEKYPTRTFSFNGDTKAIRGFFDNLYNSGTPIEGRPSSRVVDRYYLLGNNCTTGVCNGLRAGGINVPVIQTPAAFIRHMMNYYNQSTIPITNPRIR